MQEGTFERKNERQGRPLEAWPLDRQGAVRHGGRPYGGNGVSAAVNGAVEPSIVAGHGMPCPYNCEASSSGLWRKLTIPG
jgi:hypothetical protein